MVHNYASYLTFDLLSRHHFILLEMSVILKEIEYDLASNNLNTESFVSLLSCAQRHKGLFVKFSLHWVILTVTI